MNLNKLLKKFSFLVLVMVFTVGTAFAQTNWYVSKTNGDDLNNNGTSFTDAYATITKAVAAASDNDKIYIHAGTYNEEGGIGTPTPVTIGISVELIAVELNNDTDVVFPEGLVVNGAGKTVTVGTDAASESFILEDGAVVAPITAADEAALELLDGSLVIDGSKVTIEAGANVLRVDGTIDSAPTFAGDVDVTYDNFAANTTAGAELPANLGTTGILLVNDQGNGTTVDFPNAVEVNDLTVTSGVVEFVGAVTVNNNADLDDDATFQSGLTMTGGPGTSINVANGTTTDVRANSTIDADITTPGTLQLNSTTLTWGNTGGGALTLTNAGDIISDAAATVGDATLMLTGDQALNLQGNLPNVNIPAGFTNTATVDAATGIYGTVTVGSATVPALNAAAGPLTVTVFGDFLRTDDTDGNIDFLTNNTVLTFDGGSNTFDPGETLTIYDLTVNLDDVANVITLDESLRLEGDLTITQGVLGIGSYNLRMIGTAPQTVTNDGGYTTNNDGFLIWQNAQNEDAGNLTVVENMIDGTEPFGNMDIRNSTDVVIADGATIKFSGILNLRDGNLMFDDNAMQLTDDLVTVPTINYYTDNGVFDNTTDANGGAGVGGLLSVAAGVEYDLYYYGDLTTNADFEFLAAGIRHLTQKTTAGGVTDLQVPQDSEITGQLYVESGEVMDLADAVLTMSGDNMTHTVLGTVNDQTGTDPLTFTGNGSTLLGSTDDADERLVEHVAINTASGETFNVTNIHGITGNLTVADGTVNVTLVGDPTNDEDSYITGNTTLTDGELTLAVPDEVDGDDGTLNEVGGNLLIVDGTLILATDIIVAGTTDLGNGAAATGAIQLDTFDLTLGDQFTHNGTGNITGDGWVIADYSVGATSQNFILTTPLEISNLEINDGGAASTITLTTDDLTVTNALLFTQGTFDVNALDLTVTGNSVEYVGGALAATGGGNFILNGTTMQLDLNANFAVAPNVEVDATSLAVVDADGNGPYTVTVALDFTQTAGDISLADNTLELQTDFTRVDGAWSMGDGFLHLNTIGTIDHGTGFVVPNLKVEGAAAIFPDEQAWRISNNLVLVDANLNPGDDDGTGNGNAQLTFSDDATIERQDNVATLADEAMYDGDINLKYTTDAGGITTSEEASATTIADLTTEVILTLERDVTVNGILKIDDRTGAGAGAIVATANDADANGDDILTVASTGSVYFVDTDGNDVDEAINFAGDVDVTYENATAGAVSTTNVIEGTAANPNTIANLVVDGDAAADDVALHRNMTIAGDLSIIDDGALDLASSTLNLEGDFTQSGAGDIEDNTTVGALRFAGGNDQTITLSEDWVVNDANYTFGVNKSNLTTAATITGGDIDFATNGATLYLDNGILATDANSTVILEQHSDANTDQGSLNTQPTQGFVVGAGNTSFVSGNVKKYLSPFDDDANINNNGDYDASIALTRVEFPVGSLPASDGYDRLLALSFNTLPTAAVNITVTHDGSKAPGENGFPIDATDSQGDPMLITNMASFHWTVKSDRTLQSQVQYDVEARAAGYEEEYSTDEVEDIRLVRRYDNNDDNPWLLQGATGYDNSTDNVNAQAVVIAKDAEGAISDQGAVFTYSQNNKAPDFAKTADVDGVDSTITNSAITIDEGDSLSVEYTITDPDLGDTPSYTQFSVLPTGATVAYDGTTATVTWKTDNLSAGADQLVVLEAEDTYGLTSRDTLKVTVNDVNVAPEFVDVPGDTVEAPEGSVYSFTFTASDADTDNETFTYSVEGTPDSVSIVDSTGVLSFNPAFGEEGKEVPVTVYVEDDNGAQDTTSFLFVVVDQNRAPYFTTAMPDTSVDEGAMLALDFSGNATDDDGDPVTFEHRLYDSEGTMLDTLNGAMATTGEFTWTPEYTQAGTYTLIAVATDGTDTGEDTVAVVVNDMNAAPMWTKVLPDTTIFVGDTLDFTYIATDLDMDEVTYGWNGPHDSRASLTSDGVLTWDPMTENDFISLVKVYATDGTDTITTAAEVTVEVTSVTVSGTVAYENTGMDAVEDVTVKLWQDGSVLDSTVTDSTGAYSFSAVNAGEYQISASKEGNWPASAVLASDALLAARSAVDTTVTLTAMQEMAADVSNDGVVNSFDALQILQRVVKLIDSFAIADWQFEMKDVTVSTTAKVVDIKAIAAGDVDESYTASQQLAKESTVSAFEEETLQISPNAEFELPIKLDAVDNVSALTLRFAYPAEKVELVSTKSVAGNVLTNAENGVLNIAWADLTGKEALEADGSTLVVLKFKATEAFKKSESVSLTLEEGEVVNKFGKAIDGSSVALSGVEISIPETFALNNNYPNPFNPTTTISYDLPVQGKVRLTIFNSLGQEVSTIVNQVQEAGSYKAIWNASNVASGVYFFNISVDGVKNFVQTKKMILLK